MGGCSTGLVCGVDNCKKFHKLGSSTGMGSSSDCCYAPYPSCAQHSKCDTNSFCATMCHTGNCGNQANVVAGTAGKFCQPCTRCNFPSDSVSGDCLKCLPPTTKAAPLPMAPEAQAQAKDLSTTPGTDEHKDKPQQKQIKTDASSCVRISAAAILVGWVLFL